MYTIQPADGWTSDDHDFDITPEETAILLIELEIPFDLTAVGGPRDGWLLDNGFQELDVETGDIIFQWQASAHWDLTESYHPLSAGTNESTAWDFFHMNSVQKDTHGNYLISSRHMSTLAYIDGRTGNVRWKLGGKENVFFDLAKNGTIFNGQHHARFLQEIRAENGTAVISVFDNGSGGQALTHPTQGKILEVDTHGLTARMRQAYPSPHKQIHSENRGSMQVLPNGQVLLGFGSTAAWAQFAANGSLLCDIHFGPESGFNQREVLSYRILKQPWLGHPRRQPSLVVEGDAIYVSWNGETEVTAWELQAVVYDLTGDTGPEYLMLIATQKNGFETRISVPKYNSQRYLRVVGRDKRGIEIGYTTVVDIYSYDLGRLVVQQQ